MPRRLQFGRVRKLAVVAAAVFFCVDYLADVVPILLGPADHDVTRREIRVTAWLTFGWWWLAVVCLVGSPAAFRPLGRPVWKCGRTLYTVGCGAYLLHVAVAFHLGHGWSHAAAYDHVAAAGGFGPGIFVSYLFTAVWVIDVCWSWASLDGYRRRPAWVSRAIHGFMLFVVVNATVVFASGWPRWVAAGLLIGLWLAYLGRNRRHRHPRFVTL